MFFEYLFTTFTEWKSSETTNGGYPNGTLCIEGGGEFHGHPNFAMAMLAPILLSTLFLIPQWLRQEQTKKRILTTLPLVLFQLYPQFKMLELLYLGLWKKDSKWRSKKDELQKSVSYIGKLKGNTTT